MNAAAISMLLIGVTVEMPASDAANMAMAFKGAHSICTSYAMDKTKEGEKFYVGDYYECMSVSYAFIGDR